VLILKAFLKSLIFNSFFIDRFFVIFGQMISDEIRKKLQNIVRGTCLEGAADRCSTVRNHLIEGFGTSPTVKGEFESRSIIKEKQIEFLKTYAKESGLWLESLVPQPEYLTKGGESKVYLAADGLNSLLGFIENDGKLNAALSQPFIEGEQAKLENIKDLLSFNGFENTKRQDYYNKEFGLVLEDMHDENVIVRQDVLFFIDTVFYIMTI
jgi:hypothetical protein